jgi:Tfp pilus assembly protein PilO
MVKEPRAGTGGPGSDKATGPNRAGITLKPSKQICLILGGLIAVLLVGGIGLYVWQAGEIAEIEKIVRQKKEEVTAGEKIAQQLNQLELEYSVMQKQLRFLESDVSQPSYIPTWLKQAEGLAKTVNLNFNSAKPTFVPAPPPPKDEEQRKKWVPQPYDTYKVDMEIQGTYWNIARFLYRLTEFQKIMSVDTVSINSRNAGLGAYDEKLTAKLLITAFVFTPDDKKPKTADSNTEQQGDEKPSQSASIGRTEASRDGGA